MKTKLLLTATLCLIASVSFSQLKSLAGVGISDEEKAMKEEMKKREEARFAGRPETPGEDITNFNENVPAKKEKFTDKMARFKSEGFEVAVVLNSGKIYTTPITSGLTKEEFDKFHNVSLEGSLTSMYDSFTAIRDSYIAKMNKTYNTDVFVPVNMKNIPYREIKGHKVDNWEDTKYKIYIILTIQPEYSYGVAKNKDYSAKLLVNIYAPIMETYNAKGKVKIKQHVLNAGLGRYESETTKFAAKPDITKIEELAELVNTPSTEDIITKLQEAYNERIDKYIEKVK